MSQDKKTQKGWFLKPSALIATVLICGLSYLFFDIPIAEHFKGSSPSLKRVARLISDLIDSDHQLFVWPILFFCFRLLWNKEQVANRCLLLVMSIPMSDLLSGLIKFILGRARPIMLFSSEQFGFTYFSREDAFQSMPSGHACAIGAICGAFSCFYPKATFPLYILALFLAFSARVVQTKHYLSDIIAGIAIGFFVTQWLYFMMRRKNIPFTRRSHGSSI